MTTICTDGVTIACDSRRCRGSELVDDLTMKIKIRDGCIYAFTGDFAAFGPAIEWHSKGTPKGEQPLGHKDGGWSLMVIDAAGLHRFTSDLPYPEFFAYPIAFGSGSDFAMAAMRLGKTPKEAIALAATFDLFTGGPVHVVTIADVVGLIREAAE